MRFDRVGLAVLWLIDHGATTEQIRDFLEFVIGAPKAPGKDKTPPQFLK